MNCPYCGNNVDDKKEFCSKCGNRLISHNVTTNIEISDTKELETFIGTNIHKIKVSRVSIPSLFLGSFYYLYRKMYLLGFSLIIISLLYSTGLNYIPDEYNLYYTTIYMIFSLLVNIILFIKFNSIYINHANKKISKIKNNNKNKSRFEIVEKIKYSGGTNLFVPVLVFALVITINSIIYYKINDVKDNLSNAKYKVTEGYKETNAEISLNEDDSFIWYSNKDNKEDNFYVGKYKVYVGRNALRVAKNYKLYTDRIKDKNNYYILKLYINRKSNKGVISDTNIVLVYYGLYNENNKTIDLNQVGNRDYFRLVKIK